MATGEPLAYSTHRHATPAGGERSRRNCQYSSGDGAELECDFQGLTPVDLPYFQWVVKQLCHPAESIV